MVGEYGPRFVNLPHPHPQHTPPRQNKKKRKKFCVLSHDCKYRLYLDSKTEKKIKARKVGVATSNASPSNRLF